MNINKLINRLKRLQTPDWEQFKTIFYEEKLKEIQYTPKTAQALAFFNNAISLIIGYIMETQRNVQIDNNLRFTINDCWVGCYVNIHCVGWFDISKIHLNEKKDAREHKLQEIANSIPNEEYQKIVDSLPEWNEEFKTICRENVKQIEAIIFGKFDPRYDILYHYLEQKIELMKFLCYGERGATASKLKALGFPFEKRITAPESITRNGITFISDPIPNDWIIRCNNFTIKKGRWPRGKMIFNIANIGISPHQNLPAETIREIDRSVPQWIEEAKALQHELDKRQKIKQINKNTTATLVKNRMCELGFEYQLKGRSLEVKLLYGRKLVVRLPDNPATVERLLGRLPQYVEAVNSVPDEYRVTNHIRTNATDETTDNADDKMGDWKTNGIPFEITFEEIIVRLSKNREMSRQLNTLTMNEIAQVCDEMPAYIDAIDSVPFYFRIRPILSCDKWEKGS